VNKYIGALTEVQVNSQGAPDVGWILLTGTLPSPACTSANWLKMDLTQPSMKLALAAAMTALAAGRQVRLRGNGPCSGGYEWLEYIAVR
jgi:hypothetical protein